MKKYRIAYDVLFVPHPLDGFTYRGSQIEGISIYFIYHYFNSVTGKERLFKKDEQPHIAYSCSIDKDTGYKMSRRNNVEGRVTYTPADCYVYEDDLCAEPREISLGVAIDILKNNYDMFDNAINRPAQSGSYYSVKVR